MSHIIIDWGSTAFRAYLVDETGKLVDKKVSDRGVFSFEGPVFEEKGFEAFLAQTCGDWLTDHRKIVMAGMIGSRNGWQEAPYLPCPVDLSALSQGLMPVDNNLGLDIRIAPGVNQVLQDRHADVMRGEEIQIFGALAKLGLTDGLVCLPGTHSKWAWVDDSTGCLAIHSFNTFMTGELFALLNQHSSLAGLLDKQKGAPLNERAFIDGLESAQQPGGLLNRLFAPRANVLSGILAPDKAYTFLSGLLIGSEFAGALALGEAREVVFVGNETLLSLYAIAAEHFGVGFTAVDAESAVIAGLLGVVGGF